MNRIMTPLLCLLVPAGCTQARDWAFVQAVGGIAIAQPLIMDQRLVLPLRVNVSGLEQITVKPSLLNSGLVCAGVSVARNGQEILLTIRTAPAQQGLSPRCPAADLGVLPPGTYRVFYLSSDGSKQAIGGFSL